MKNLKRVLSLGLASVMLLGMMVVGASAANTKDFTDAGEIQNVEAVTTMAALNVIAGKDDGSFDPTGNVKRGEMAKMITVMLNGGNDPVLSVGSTPKFSDTANHWARKYIEYCAAEQQGVISGRGNGIFDPDGNVTGSEAAKMILVALGYNSEIFKFVGVDWEINVNSRANAPEAQLYKELNINPSAPLSRDNAAQMLYNALEAKIVVPNYTITSNGVETNYVPSTTRTFMMEKFNTLKAEGIITSNDIVALDGTNASVTEEGNTQLTLTEDLLNANGTVREPAIITDSNGQNPTANTITLNTASDLDILGRSVTVYVKWNSKSASYDVVGGIVVSSKNIVSTNVKGESDFTKINKKVQPASGTQYYVNYELQAGSGAAAAASAAVKPGTVVTVVSNDGKKDADFIFVTNYTFDQVTKVDSKKETIRFKSEGAATAYENIIGSYEDLEADDYVLTTKVKVTGSTSPVVYKMIVETPTTIEGEMNAYKNNSDADIVGLTVEGEKYDISWADNESDLTEAKESKDYLDEDATFYLDANGLIVAVSNKVEAAANYAISWGGAGGNVIDTGRIKMTMADGTTKIYTISEKSNWIINSSNNGKEFKWNGSVNNAPSNQTPSAVGVLVTYAFDDDGNIKISFPTVKSVGTNGQPAGATYDYSGTTFTAGKTLVTVGTAGQSGLTNTKSYQTNSATPFFYVTTNSDNAVSKVEVVTGYANAKGVNGVDTSAEVAIKGEKAQAVAYVDYIPAEGAKTDLSKHLYVVSVDRTYTNYVTATVYLAGEEETTTVQLERSDDIEGSAENNNFAPYVGDIFLYTINSKDRYELVALDDSDSGLTANKDYFLNEIIGKTSDISIELGIDTGDADEYFIEEDSVIIGYDEDDEVYANLAGSVNGGDTLKLLVDTKNDKVLMAVTKACAHEDLDESNKTKVDATCTKDGHEAYWTCNACKKVFGAAADGSVDLTEALEAVPVLKKTGHDWDTETDATKHACKNASCDKASGEAHTFEFKDGKHVCSVCSAEHAVAWDGGDSATTGADCAKKAETGCTLTKP